MMLVVGVVVLVAAGADVGSPPATFRCPPELAVSEEGKGAPAGWAATDFDGDRLHRFTAAGLFEGEPARRMALRPQGSEGTVGGERYVQHFRWSQPAPDGIFLVCHYEGTNVIAYQRVHPAPRRCDLETKLRPTGPVPASVRCE